MDPIVIGYVIAILVFICLSAFFSMSETAFTSVSEIKLKKMANEGDRKAERAIGILENYDKFLTTILIGNNLVNLDVLRVIRWIGVEPSVAVPGRKRRMTQYGFHSLRHTFASHCAEAGVPKAVLLSILGTDSDIADKYYTHIGEEAQLKAIEAVTGSVAVSAREKIHHALAYLASLPASFERQTLENILNGA